MRAYFDQHGHYRGTSLGCGGLSLAMLLPALLLIAVGAVVFCWPLLVIHHGPWRVLAEVSWLALLAVARSALVHWSHR